MHSFFDWSTMPFAVKFLKRSSENCYWNCCSLLLDSSATVDFLFHYIYTSMNLTTQENLSKNLSMFMHIFMYCGGNGKTLENCYQNFWSVAFCNDYRFAFCYFCMNLTIHENLWKPEYFYAYMHVLCCRDKNLYIYIYICTYQSIETWKWKTFESWHTSF